VPCVPPRLSFYLFFLFPSFNRSLPWSYLLPYHRLPPQITAAERLRGQRETVKKGKTENLRGVGALVRVCLFFSTKDQWASISGLSVNSGAQSEQAADWINMDDK